MFKIIIYLYVIGFAGLDDSVYKEGKSHSSQSVGVSVGCTVFTDVLSVRPEQPIQLNDSHITAYNQNDYCFPARR